VAGGYRGCYPGGDARDRGSIMRPPLRAAANAAAAVVVGKRGHRHGSRPWSCAPAILPAASLAPEEKIVFDWAVLDERLAEWRGLRIGFTKWVLRSSSSRAHQAIVGDGAAKCDRLIVGLNSDFVRAAIEGRGEAGAADPWRAPRYLRPWQAVDLVVIFDQDTPPRIDPSRTPRRSWPKAGDYRREGGRGPCGWSRRTGGQVILIGPRARLQHHQNRPINRVRRDRIR